LCGVVWCCVVYSGVSNVCMYVILLISIIIISMSINSMKQKEGESVARKGTAKGAMIGFLWLWLSLPCFSLTYSLILHYTIRDRKDVV